MSTHAHSSLGATGAQFILAIDQGTTSSRAMIYTAELAVVGRGQQEFTQHFPANGHVEHNPLDIWQSTLSACQQALTEAKLSPQQLTCLGITNQRETTLVWDKATGKPLHNAIVWQDRRTAAVTEQLKADGYEAMVQEKTGLLLDPYFSASKIAWILNHVEGARARAEAGELAFGTVDSFLLWQLSGGSVHATDATNASRTSLFNIHTGNWDTELCTLFNVPMAMLPDVHDNAANFGVANYALFTANTPAQLAAQGSAKPNQEGVAITAMVGDQQGALVGQACFREGELKSTYGTGCFALVNTGSKAVHSSQRLLTTIAYQLQGKTTYAIEGSIFMAGAIVQWLRDKLGIIQTAAETETLASGVDYQQSEMLIPAFTGLGAPYWQPNARAAIFGMTRNTGRAELAAAALRSVALQTKDLLTAMKADGLTIDVLKVDGGMTENQLFLQALADINGIPVVRAEHAEISVRGAAFLAGLQAGIFAELSNMDALCASSAELQPELSAQARNAFYQRWLAAVAKIR